MRLQAKDVRQTYADQRGERDGEYQQDEDHPHRALQSAAKVEMSLS